MPKTARMNLRLPPELVKSIRDYATRRGMNVTFLVESHFRALLEEEARATQPAIDAEQI